eukprot:TRINITY_DN2640_c0_g4_i1.p1 TRINITY_DN2640_c0_g4~~TRINITY_DN2640_c0_g4_i1.p1  ORF type:complete len:253 (-),score=40.48 TRINITY_DN2640_c0_g4_i1:514-1272(-)
MKSNGFEFRIWDSTSNSYLPEIAKAGVDYAIAEPDHVYEMHLEVPASVFATHNMIRAAFFVDSVAIGGFVRQSAWTVRCLGFYNRDGHKQFVFRHPLIADGATAQSTGCGHLKVRITSVCETGERRSNSYGPEVVTKNTAPKKIGSGLATQAGKLVNSTGSADYAVTKEFAFLGEMTIQCATNSMLWLQKVLTLDDDRALLPAHVRDGTYNEERYQPQQRIKRSREDEQYCDLTTGREKWTGKASAAVVYLD